MAYFATLVHLLHIFRKMCAIFVKKLSAAFRQYADAASAEPMKQYMRNQFDFYGLKAPLRRSLQRSVLQAHPIQQPDELQQIALALYEKDEREYHYAAVDLLYVKRKLLDGQVVPLLSQLITTKSWWDTVDGLAAKVVGHVFRAYPRLQTEVVSNWRQSSDIWLRRSCLLHQLHYKSETNLSLLTSLIKEQATSEEFFIQKAIGWALRQYSYTDAAFVRSFVEETPLSALSRKEALKALDRSLAKASTHLQAQHKK